MHIQTNAGHSIHVKDMGEGRPVILIHGWPLTGDMWEYQTLALLEAGFRVITYDRRGFGQSGHPAGGYAYDVFADDLAAVIGHIGADKVSLVGFSMGGGEIARYLARHGSARVERAVLVSSVVPYLLKDETNPDGVDISVFEEAKAALRKDRFAFLRTFGRQFFGAGIMLSPVSEALMDWTFALAIMASPKATIDCVDAYAHTDFRPDLRAFDVPTLVIHGSSDKVVPVAIGRAAAEGIAGARFVEYDGEPHGLFATAPDRLNTDLLAFLGQVHLAPAEA